MYIKDVVNSFSLQKQFYNDSDDKITLSAVSCLNQMLEQ